MYGNNKCITICEDNLDKNKTQDEKGYETLKKKSFKEIYYKILINNENKNDKRNETVYKLNKDISIKNFKNVLSYKEIKNKKRNHSYEIHSKSKINKIKNNNNNITI